MLTADLVRGTVKDGELHCRFVDATSEPHLERAEQLIDTFEASVGQRRGLLDDALADFIGTSTDFKLLKGLIKLLTERCKFVMASTLDPPAVRKRLFELAAERGPISRQEEPVLGVWRGTILQVVAEEMETTAEEVDAAMYADGREHELLESFETIEPGVLLERYNTSLVQGVLLKAHELEIELEGTSPKRWRALFRAVKFFGLSYRIRRQEESTVLHLDGPLSLFRLSTKYGLRMASFFPALLLADGWSFTSKVKWEQRKRLIKFNLDSSCGLVSHYKDRGTWTSEEEAWLVERLEEKCADKGWSLTRAAEVLVVGGGEVLVPDFTLKHEDGRQAHVEVLWFWRRGSLQPRLRSLAKAKGLPYVLAISEKLRGSEEDVRAAKVPIVRFKTALRAKLLLEAVERVAA